MMEVGDGVDKEDASEPIDDAVGGKEVEVTLGNVFVKLGVEGPTFGALRLSVDGVEPSGPVIDGLELSKDMVKLGVLMLCVFKMGVPGPDAEESRLDDKSVPVRSDDCPDIGRNVLADTRLDDNSVPDCSDVGGNVLADTKLDVEPIVVRTVLIEKLVDPTVPLELGNNRGLAYRALYANIIPGLTVALPKTTELRS